MRVDLFDFDLPEDRIALRPAVPRDAARMLEVAGDQLGDWRISDLPARLAPGDTLVVNRTRVIPARLHARRMERPNEALDNPTPRIEATLHKPVGPSTWTAFAKPGKRLAEGDRIEFAHGLTATVLQKGEGGEITLDFNCAGDDLDRAIERAGEMPLPPYIASKRGVDDQDRDDYQTVFAEEEGSVAAPTAGLHFTPALIEGLKERDIAIEEVILHVGAGTFLPVKSDLTEDHKMHAEWGRITPQTATALNERRKAGGRIIAVGTTSLRLLESAAGPAGMIEPFEGETDIFITPGYRFRSIDGLLTNFHLPRSTLFMLVSAFAGLDTMKAAYVHAIANGYRFYSYGDACLLWPEARK